MSDGNNRRSQNGKGCIDSDWPFHDYRMEQALVVIPKTASRDEVLSIVLSWIDELAKKNFNGVAEALGYSLAYGELIEDCIRGQIARYRSPDLYPGESKFEVTDWRTAQGGNPTPTRCVTFYKENSLRLAGAVSFDLPLNGRWSDLTADFVFFDSDRSSDGFVLSLEEIGSNAQWQREVPLIQRGT